MKPVDDGADQLARQAYGFIQRLMPAGSTPRRVVVRTVRRLARAGNVAWVRAQKDYRVWTAARRPRAAELERERALSRQLTETTKVHAVIIDHGDATAVARTFASLQRQTWSHWKATVSNATADTMNAALREAAPEDLIVFLEAGDELTPDCFFDVAAVCHRDPLVDLIYWDDDAPLENHRRLPRFHPEWSPETLLSANYVDCSFAIRYRRLVSSGGLRRDVADAGLWDLLLRADLTAEQVCRIPRVLGHIAGRRTYSDETALRVIDDRLAQLGWPAQTRLEHGTVRIDWKLDSWPHVTIIVPSRHNTALLGRLLEGLAGTDYPSFDVVVVDNGEHSAGNERWYAQFAGRVDVGVLWWDRPFNYSAVNNAGAAGARGDILVFLNDDIEVLDTRWLRELVGWASQESIGVVGSQMIDRSGLIQHGGVIVGLSGFAGHLFAGMRPGDESLLGSTRWYRNVLAVTGACLAIRRRLLVQLGGFDEKMILCGSDIALGIAAHSAGLRNVCTHATTLRHLESATRGADPIPAGDFCASYWHYQHWLHAGDPYFSPNVSPHHTEPQLRGLGEPGSLGIVERHLGRSLQAYDQRHDLPRADVYPAQCRISRGELDALGALHARNRGRLAMTTVSWFIPGMDSPFYGGINTALRIADVLTRRHGVNNRFVFTTPLPDAYVRSAIAAAFPALAGSAISVAETDEDFAGEPPVDAAISTLWSTAYPVARHVNARRKFYLVQDFEPMFYPAGTIYALAEESYRLGLYGICNTENLARIYRDRYGGRAMSFTPAVDTSVFHDAGRDHSASPSPITLFVYARPGHWRNCWELASPALREIKDRLGDRIRILTAGSWQIRDDPDRLPAVRHLGLLDYRATGELYRHCDIGLALTVTEHPSYLPLELMACGAAVVAFDNPAGRWLLRHEDNCLLTPRTVDGLVDAIERLVIDAPLRQQLAGQGLRDIAAAHSDWEAALSGVYDYLCDPEATVADNALSLTAQAPDGDALATRSERSRGSRPNPSRTRRGN